MESLNEEQQEEVEVLQSIYDGDDSFKQLEPSVYQYKYGEDQTPKSCVLEVRWTPAYPEELPNINLDAFYNRHLTSEVRDKVISALTEQAEMNLGMAMTYTLFEWMKENSEDLMASQPEVSVSSAPAETTASRAVSEKSDKKPKKEQLTKSQKRRMFDKFGTMQQDKPRGWDWVDVIRHLSQTGSKPDTT